MKFDLFSRLHVFLFLLEDLVRNMVLTIYEKFVQKLEVLFRHLFHKLSIPLTSSFLNLYSRSKWVDNTQSRLQVWVRINVSCNKGDVVRKKYKWGVFHKVRFPSYVSVSLLNVSFRPQKTLNTDTVYEQTENYFYLLTNIQ